MKKFEKLKILLSISLMFTMLLPNVSAYYGSFALMLDINSPTCMRYPMHRGTNVKLARGIRRDSFSKSYTIFLLRNSLENDADQTEGRYLSVSTQQQCYEKELKHIGACSYATAVLLGCQVPEAVRFSEKMVRLSNFLTGYPKNFNENLYIYVANYIYGILGFLYKEGTVDDVRSNSLYRFSSLAHLYSSHFCSIERVPCVSHISEETFKLQTEGQ